MKWITSLNLVLEALNIIFNGCILSELLQDFYLLGVL